MTPNERSEQQAPGGEAEWLAANQRWLACSLDVVRAALARQVARRAGDEAALADVDAAERAAISARNEARRALDPPPPLESLCRLFGLSPFERDVLLVCAGMELDASFLPLVGSAHGDARRARFSFGLALAALADPHWSALTPQRPLRAFHLVLVAHEAGLTRAELEIDERILHYLCGVDAIDERLRSIMIQLAPPDALLPSSQAAAERAALAWCADPAPVVQLCGESSDAPIIAAAAAAMIGVRLHVLRATDAPTGAAPRESLSVLWAREAALRAGALLIACRDGDGDDAIRAAAAFAECGGRLVAIAAREPLLLHRGSMRISVGRPTRVEQRALWQMVLGERAASMNGALDRVVSQFRLNIASLHAASDEALARAAGDVPLDASVWDACRTQARPRLEALAGQIEPTATWDDLVLPDAERSTLREIAAHVRQCVKVYEEWGFGRGGRGLGMSALFAGASGTGKTFAAEVIANELSLDLFRIDLSQVVSKYIGETEKNLRRVFDAAEDGSAVLLFDEADALFGKRTEVRDSHDRYANIEVSYLLQRMEAYRGVAILTTNMKEALDPAFLRRLRFVVQFPFPDAAERREIWRRVFPSSLPREGIDDWLLARLTIAGGNIRNIAVNAAFLAAEEGRPVQMRHVLRSAESEYAKLGRPLTEIDLRGVV